MTDNSQHTHHCPNCGAKRNRAVREALKQEPYWRAYLDGANLVGARIDAIVEESTDD